MGGSGSGSSDFGTKRGGGGGSGAGGGPADGGSRRFDCASYRAKTILRSPKKDVIESLQVEDMLDLQLTAKKPPILAKTQDDEVAGSVVVPEIEDLVKCINAKHQYVAEVMSIQGGSCVVEIYLWEDE